MNQEILNYINEETHVEMLEEKSTKEIAQEFNIDMKAAYLILNKMFSEGLINKLEPVNGNKFDCCGWIRLND
jgi:predicted transcriptional regulator